MMNTQSSQVAAESVEAAIVELDATDWALGPGAVSWKLMRDPAVFLVGQIRTSMLLLMHLPFAASAEHDTFLVDPVLRYRRVGMYGYSVTYGTKADAQRLSHMVRTRHTQIKGIEPVTRRPYQSNSEYELALTHVIQASSYLAIYEAIHGVLSKQERDDYYLEQKIPSALLGINPSYLPSTYQETEDFLSSARQHFAVTARARRLMSVHDNGHFAPGTVIGDLPFFKRRGIEFVARVTVDMALATLPPEDRLVLAINRRPKLLFRSAVLQSLKLVSAFMRSRRGLAYWDFYLQPKTARIFRRALQIEDVFLRENPGARFQVPDAGPCYHELPDLKRNWPGSPHRYAVGREVEGEVIFDESQVADQPTVREPLRAVS